MVFVHWYFVKSSPKWTGVKKLSKNLLSISDLEAVATMADFLTGLCGFDVWPGEGNISENLTLSRKKMSLQEKIFICKKLRNTKKLLFYNSLLINWASVPPILIQTKNLNKVGWLDYATFFINSCQLVVDQIAYIYWKKYVKLYCCQSLV